MTVQLARRFSRAWLIVGAVAIVLYVPAYMLGIFDGPLLGLVALAGCRWHYWGGWLSGRKAVARELEAEADDEAQRPNRSCCSRQIEKWLREGARMARSDP